MGQITEIKERTAAVSVLSLYTLCGQSSIVCTHSLANASLSTVGVSALVLAVKGQRMSEDLVGLLCVEMRYGNMQFC